jgi:hypothetical protein
MVETDRQKNAAITGIIAKVIVVGINATLYHTTREKMRENGDIFIMTNWKIEKTVDGENEIITIIRPINDKPKSAACVSRTVKAGTVARVKYARFNDDFSVDTGEMVKQFDGVLDPEKVEKALHNAEPCTKWQVLDVQPKDENTLGIPRDVFNAVAVPIERPLSQQ